MIQLIKIEYRDDKDASKSIEVMVCSSISAAKEVNKLCLSDFEEDGETFGKKSLDEIASILDNEIEECSWNEENKTFSWFDNGKGETYIIARVNMREVNNKFQRIGEI
jgi:hypothetical protein